MLKCIKNSISNIRRNEDEDEARRRAQCRANAQRAIDAAQQKIEAAQQKIEECQTQIDNFTAKRDEIAGKRGQAQSLMVDCASTYSEVYSCVPGMPINNRDIIKENFNCLQKYSEACVAAELTCTSKINEYQAKKAEAQQEKQVAMNEKRIAQQEKQQC